MKPALLAILMLASVALCAATAGDTVRVVNERFHFAFTVEPFTKVTYEKDGVGFSAAHTPTKASKPDYGLLVYGSPAMHLSTEDAKAAGLAKVEDTMLSAADVDAAKWPEQFGAVMESRGRTRGGEAKVKSGKKTHYVPYYTWDQIVAGRKHYALMYVALHAGAFVYVQVESSQPLGKSQLEWMTGKLELIELPKAP